MDTNYGYERSSFRCPFGVTTGVFDQFTISNTDPRALRAVQCSHPGPARSRVLVRSCPP